jgi:hypothetical protein
MEITSNLSSAKIATKRFASHTESEINHKQENCSRAARGVD